MKSHYLFSKTSIISKTLEYAEMYRIEKLVWQSFMGSILQRAEVGEGLNLFTERLERQVLINRVIRAPGNDTIERMKDAKQRCALKFSSSVFASTSGNSGSAFAQYKMKPDFYLGAEVGWAWGEGALTVPQPTFWSLSH